MGFLDVVAAGQADDLSFVEFAIVMILNVLNTCVLIW